MMEIKKYKKEKKPADRLSADLSFLVLPDQCNVPEEADQCIGNRGHRFDEDIQCDAYNILAGVADCVAGYCSLMRRRTFAETLQ